MGKQKQQHRQAAAKPSFPVGVKKKQQQQQQSRGRKDLKNAKNHSKGVQQQQHRNPHAAFSGLGETNLNALLDTTAEELSQRHNIRSSKHGKPKDHQPAFAPQQESQAAMDEEGPQVPCLHHGESEQAAADGSGQQHHHHKQPPVMQETHTVPHLSHQELLQTLSGFDLK